ncbi:hypothetical protein DBT_1125 [Dissulfuribacter thermophilus]|uniref:DUF2760 domain-containing protein n=1 Tax=Dissulfuribacter thermophilus TaxID=1156395 RepID=A0A1B9F603_9BACT|nr:DUF2760 domain-containing protein [Dissulfuribacter thermophilus]OCC15378.1 hypothetical protein DBT_1125 [Dissulfuribacter thermophilus]
MERYLYLVLALVGAGAIYYDQDLLNTWIGPAIVGGPIVAWIIATIASKQKKAPEVGKVHEEKKAGPKEVQPEEVLKVEPKEETVAGPTLEDIEEHADEYRKEGIIWLLSVFQREGRLIDFIEEDITPFDDAQVGAAARQVHQGLRNALKDVLTLGPIIDAQEGTEIEVDEDYDPKKIRLTGNLTGKPPYKGSLMHPGWKINALNLPSFGQRAKSEIISQAEVEIN